MDLNFNIVNFDARILKIEVYNGRKALNDFKQGEMYAWVDFAYYCKEMLKALGGDEITISTLRGDSTSWLARFYGYEGTIAIVTFEMILTPMGVDSKSDLEKAINTEWDRF